MKFIEIISEAEIQKNQIDAADLTNPQLKNILNRIEQTKKKHQAEMQNLMKQLEQVKAKNNQKMNTQGGIPQVG